MASAPEMLIARCNVTSAAEDPNYRQAVHCGRHNLLADERPQHGGADAGPTPFEYLLSALGACTSITLRMYAERKQWHLGAVTVSLTMHQAPEGNRIERRVSLSGTVTADQQARLAEICEKTPVTLALKSGVRIATHVGAVGQ